MESKGKKEGSIQKCPPSWLKAPMERLPNLPDSWFLQPLDNCDLWVNRALVLCPTEIVLAF